MKAQSSVNQDLSVAAYSTANEAASKFSEVMRFWKRRDVLDQRVCPGADVVCPTLDICAGYRLEVEDKLHRRGFVLREKMQEYDRIYAQLSPCADEQWRNDFWSWLDFCAGGRAIPSVQSLPVVERANYRARFEGNHLRLPIGVADRSAQELIYVMDSRGDFFVHPKFLGLANTVSQDCIE